MALILESKTFKQQINFDSDINKIIDAFTHADHDQLTSSLHNTLKCSDIVRVLDDRISCNSGKLQEVLRICQQLGKIDTALAWIVGVSNSAWSMKNCFNELTTNFLDDSNKILSMVLGRPGKLTVGNKSGHYLLNGIWGYASGWQYSNVFFGLAQLDAMNKSHIKVVAVPTKQMKCIQEWTSVGLRGTQSVTIKAIDIPMTPSQVIDYTEILSGNYQVANSTAENNQCLSYSGLFTGVLMCCLMGSILGATESALEFVVDCANNRPVAGSAYSSMSSSGAIRAELGRLRSALDLYKRAAEYMASLIDAAAVNPKNVLSMQDRVDNRARATQVMKGCVNIVQDLLWIYGSAGLDINCKLERIWRDVNVGARHGGFSKLVPEEAVGMAMLNQNPSDLTKMF